MNIFNTKIGQLFIGGCGTQLGLLFTLLGLGATLLFCFVCASTNALTLNLFQPTTDAKAPIPVIVQVTATPAGEVVIQRTQAGPQCCRGNGHARRGSCNVTPAGG